MAGGRWAHGGRMLLVAASVVGLATGLAACGSHNSTVGGSPGGSTSTAKSATTTTGPGWENGIWVGTGTAQDQQLIYVAKEVMLLADEASGSNSASGWQQVSEYATAAYLSELQKSLEQSVAAGEEFVDPEEDGVTAAYSKVVQVPLTAGASTTAIVSVCAISDSRFVEKVDQEPVAGLAGYVGPAVTIVTETQQKPSSPWLVNATNTERTTSCPAR